MKLNHCKTLKHICQSTFICQNGSKCYRFFFQEHQSSSNLKFKNFQKKSGKWWQTKWEKKILCLDTKYCLDNIKFVYLFKRFSNKRYKGDFVSFRCMILYVHYWLLRHLYPHMNAYKEMSRCLKVIAWFFRLKWAW